MWYNEKQKGTWVPVPPLDSWDLLFSTGMWAFNVPSPQFSKE